MVPLPDGKHCSLGSFAPGLSSDAASTAAASPVALATPSWSLPLSFHTEAFESSETEKENYCLHRAEILLSISDLGVRYLFRSSLTSPLLVRGPHYTHVYLLHAVYCQTLLASQLDFETYFTRSPHTHSPARPRARAPICPSSSTMAAATPPGLCVPP